MKFREMLNEGGHSEDMVADAFTRYILGDRNEAIKLLDKLKGEKLDTFIEKDSAEYNKQYDRIYKNFLKMIKRG